MLCIDNSLTLFSIFLLSLSILALFYLVIFSFSFSLLYYIAYSVYMYIYLCDPFLSFPLFILSSLYPVLPYSSICLFAVVFIFPFLLLSHWIFVFTFILTYFCCMSLSLLVPSHSHFKVTEVRERRKLAFSFTVWW